MKTRLALLALPALLTFCTSRVLTQDAPPPNPLEWRAKVTDAKALEDPAQRREAMLALVREALPGCEVRLSGAKHADQVHPDDNVAAPIINFDPRLNQKTSAQSRTGASTRSLQNNFGYYFSFRGAGYVVLGPAALDPRSPVFTRLAAEHELFHAMNHVGDARPIEDRELETWTEMFVRFFHDVHQFKQRWAPMLDYYQDATAGEQNVATDRLVAYYRNVEPTVRAAFDEWVARRKVDTGSSKLVHDLEKAIHNHGIHVSSSVRTHRAVCVACGITGQRLRKESDRGEGASGRDPRRPTRRVVADSRPTRPTTSWHRAHRTSCSGQARSTRGVRCSSGCSRSTSCFTPGVTLVILVPLSTASWRRGRTCS